MQRIFIDLTKKLDPERPMSEFGAPFRKKIRYKNRKNSRNQSEIPIYEPKTTNEKWRFGSNTKLGLERTITDWENQLEKKIRSKKSKKQ